MRIVFLGSPDFAAYPLRKMAEQGYEIVGVFTQPDRARGKRGKELLPTPVKQVATELGLTVFTPPRLNAPEAIAQLRELQPDLLVVVAYGQILNEDVLASAPLGAINIHASLLPFYRGAAPIQRALMAGERETGVTIMYLDKGMDTGDMILRRALPVAEDDTFGTLHDKLCDLGTEMLLEALPLIENGTAPRTAQDHQLATYAAKISREEELVSWDKSAEEMHNLIRALDPVPGAYTLFRGKRLKLFGSRPMTESGNAGEILDITDQGMVIGCAEGSLLITSVQPEGKTKMSAADFIRGYQIKIGGTI